MFFVKSHYLLNITFSELNIFVNPNIPKPTTVKLTKIVITKLIILKLLLRIEDIDWTEL